MRFSDRVVLVTGGGGAGLGSAVVRRFAAEGAAVAVADIDGGAAESVASTVRAGGGHALAVATDVRSEDAVRALTDATVREFGRVDVLVNNAFTSNPAAVLDARIDDWMRDIEVILKGTFLCSRAVLPIMIEQRAGAIVNVSSVNAHTHVGASAYSAAKAGVESLTRNLAVEFAPLGVRANAVVPGTFATQAWEARIREHPDIMADLARWYPAQRIGDIDEIASAVLFLASAEASWITGALLPVDGGLLAGNPRFAAEAHPRRGL